MFIIIWCWCKGETLICCTFSGFCKFVREYLSRLQFHLLLALLLVGRQGTRLPKLKLNNLQHLHLPVVQMQTRWIFFLRYTLYIWISDHKFEPCREFEWWFCNLFPWKQGLPNMGSNAGAGTLDFLRNSQQVSMMFYLFASLLFICDVFWYSYFRFLFQFQALRTMVQANPQILQVPIMFCLHFNFYRNIVSLVHLLPFSGGFMISFCAAYASGTWEAKSTPDATHSRASDWLLAFDKWARWRRRGVRWL